MSFLELHCRGPIFLGGLLAHWIKKRGEAARNRATLIGSGLIAGEAMAGILIAGLIYGTGKSFPVDATALGALAQNNFVSLAVFAAVIGFIWKSSVSAAASEAPGR